MYYCSLWIPLFLPSLLSPSLISVEQQTPWISRKDLFYHNLRKRKWSFVRRNSLYLKTDLRPPSSLLFPRDNGHLNKRLRLGWSWVNSSPKYIQCDCHHLHHTVSYGRDLWQTFINKLTRSCHLIIVWAINFRLQLQVGGRLRCSLLWSNWSPRFKRK